MYRLCIFSIQFITLMSKIKKGKFSNYPLSKHVLLGGQSNRSDRTPKGRLNISEMSQLDEYRKSNKVKLNEASEQKIKYSLAMDEEALRGYKRRVKNNELYLNFGKNPFMAAGKISTSQHWGEGEENRENQQGNNNVGRKNNNINIKREENLVDAVNNLKLKYDKANFDKLFTRQSNFKIFEVKVQNLQDQSSSTSPFKGKVAFTEPSQLHITTSSKNQTINRDPFAQLQDIVNMKEQSYFQTQINNKPINIFSVLFKKKGQHFFQYGPDFLQRFYFSFNSMVNQANTKSNIRIQNHISTASRRSILNFRKVASTAKKSAYKQQISLDVQKISFQDLMGVSNGKIEPDSLRNYLHKVQVNKLQDTKVVEGDVIYNQNQHQVAALNEGTDNQMSEVAYFKQEPYGKIQKRQMELSELYKKKIQKILNIEQNLDAKTVRDRILRNQLTEQKDNILLEQIQSNCNMAAKGMDIQRKIRLFKLTKDRGENIKNQIVLSTLISRKVYENSSKSKSRNKAQMAHWR